MFETATIFLVSAILLSVTMFLYSHDYDDAGLVSLSVLGVYSMISLTVTLMHAPADEVVTMYECPCEAQELVVKQITHYHKTTGDTTVTILLDVSNCETLKN